MQSLQFRFSGRGGPVKALKKAGWLGMQGVCGNRACSLCYSLNAASGRSEEPCVGSGLNSTSRDRGRSAGDHSNQLNMT
jgi:hypothetical protein